MVDHRREEDHPVDPHTEGHHTGDPLEDRQVETPLTNRGEPASQKTFDDGSCTSRGGSGSWSRRPGSTRSKSARVPPLPSRAKEELDIIKFKAGKLSVVVTKLQSRLDRLEDLRSNRSGRPLPLELGSDDSWGPGPDPGRSHRRADAPRSNHAPSTHRSAPRSDLVRSGHSGDEEQDKWLIAEYRRRRDPLRTPFQPKRPRRAPRPAPPSQGRYGPLGDEVPKEDTEWDLEGPEGDPLEDFRISPPRGSAGRRRGEEEEYMEGVRQGLLDGAYVEEPQSGQVNVEEEMDVAAVGTHEGRRWEPRSTSQLAVMVSKAADAAMWEDLKDIRPPIVRWEPPQPRRIAGEAGRLGLNRH